MKRHVVVTLALIALTLSGGSESLAESLSQVGLSVGQSYEEGKTALIVSGWRIPHDQDPSTNKPFNQYPEITCGSGAQSVCSVGFVRGAESMALIIEIHEDRFVIAGEY